MPIVLGIKKNPVTPTVLDPGLNWVFLGDSQTAGRDTGEATSHVTAFCWIWQTMRANGRLSTGPALPYNGLPSDPYQNGFSGRSLPGTIAVYDALTTERTGATMVWVQESGNQNFAGQATAEDFKATYLAFWRSVHATTPSAKKVYETAFSFGREATQYRNWDSYNVAKAEADAELALEGIDIITVETDAGVKALQAILTPADVWFQAGDANEYHYTKIGNTLVAVLGLKAMGISCILSDLADITGVSDTNKQHIIDVAEDVG